MKSSSTTQIPAPRTRARAEKWVEPVVHHLSPDVEAYWMPSGELAIDGRDISLTKAQALVLAALITTGGPR